MMDAVEFAGKVAVVTGGSEGIGHDFCRTLCGVGCEVYFCSRNADKGRLAAKALGARAHYYQADLTAPDQIQAFAAHVRESAGRVDYLINNAANDDRIKFSDLTVEDCDRMWALNLRSFLLMSRACLELLRRGEGKSVVNISTTNYMFGLSPFTVYNATKSGILGFTRSLARELGEEGIRVNMISPGWIMTEKQLRKYVTEEDKQTLLRDQCVKHLIEAKHVSPVMLFLLSSAACAMSGQNLVVDGGRYFQ
ncbi:MAG: SDR family NAD(P)-dependent oxidoreductase [Acidobacteriota bacterium]|nr:SDR family NAD(P)-dependent oxidoreductase [Acidobacteriota bacterium]